MMLDGHLNKCKECTKSENRKNYNIKKIDPEWLIKERKRTRERHYRLNYAEKYRAKTRAQKKIVKERSKSWIAKNPEKRKAHLRVGNALRSGKLTKEPCEVCGAKKVEAHHDDYSKPLDVKSVSYTHLTLPTTPYV